MNDRKFKGDEIEIKKPLYFNFLFKMQTVKSIEATEEIHLCIVEQ